MTVRKTAALLIATVAILVTAVAWLQRPDDITAAEAVRAARGAFEAAGMTDATIDNRAVAGTYDDDGSRVPVWKTSAELEDGTVGLWLSREDGESVFLDDRTPDGAAQLLTDAQFAAIGDHFENPALGRQVRRNLLVTVAAALLVFATAVLGLSERAAPASTSHRPEHP